MKILIVEDERKTGEYLRQGLNEAGFVTVNEMGGVSIRIGDGSRTTARFGHKNVTATRIWLLDLLRVEAV